MKYHMITGRTIKQGENVEHKLSQKYIEETSSCHMNPLDLMNLGIFEGEKVKLKSSCGEVVLKCVEDQGLKKGTIFIPHGPYCNSIIPGNTHGTGMPDFKSTMVEIEPTDEEILSIGRLLSGSGGIEI
ncbi:molybdopterin dinucleotide-binding protein [Methanoplanus sp. FWC-SCC4]|uniref:Molybdopterin dinucleotide-binding protein n=1 Tax=Methanochimaera problematica TaxID=2609417 RepID=A0AA97FBP5_9EURY|nr:molybdopterin dinucleotide binding domain-containing protein [Methanoplanus sp. FWC-SCC4]WOF15303.1 molybdopterin dinucleotide-binding protein [Methanoplanus sp. FWC-SCC4]